jgi:hypothetical protein
VFLMHCTHLSFTESGTWRKVGLLLAIRRQFASHAVSWRAS